MKMGSMLSSLFVPLDALPALRKFPEECLAEDFPPKGFSISGLAQLTFFGLAYGMIIFRASNLIADGSELLLLIPSIAPIVGSVVLPVLGAVPDGTIVLFSGMGPRDQVQKNLAVGVGALAGSTIMLLTVPWFLSILAGRVDLNGKMQAQYKQKPDKLSETRAFWSETGVEPENTSIRTAAKNMIITLLPYVFIQGAAFYYNKDSSEEEKSKDESGFALTGMIVCTMFFIGYMYQHVRGAAHDKVILDKTDAVRESAVRKGLISLRGAFFDLLNKNPPTLINSRSQSLLRQDSENPVTRFRSTVLHFFRKYDINGDGTIDKHELALLLRDLKVPHRIDEVENFLREMDVDASGTVSFEEFVQCMASTVKVDVEPSSRVLSTSSTSPRPASTQYGTLDANVRTLHQAHQTQRDQGETQHFPSNLPENDDNDDEEEEEEESPPEDLAHLPPDEQKVRILKRAFSQMALGVLLVLIFSDPLVEVFSELGELCGVSPFYISFILAPLASNASEIIASYYYAKRKTSKTITISLCTLMGAAVLNNTFVLGIFLSLIKFRELDWEFSAETIAILFVELVVGAVTLTRRAHTMRWGLVVLCLFPFSLLLVAFLESSYVGWD